MIDLMLDFVLAFHVMYTGLEIEYVTVTDSNRLFRDSYLICSRRASTGSDFS